MLPFVISGIFEFKEDIKLKFAGFVIALLTVVALLISGSRGAVLGLCGAYFIVMLLAEAKKYEFKQILISVFAFLVIFTAVCGVIYNVYAEALIRGYDMERVYLWKGAVNMFKDYPVFGVGSDNFNKFYVAEYIDPLAKAKNLTSPHNIFLHYLSERGLIGGGTFILLVISQLSILSKNLYSNRFTVNIWVLAGFVSVAGMCIHGFFDTQLTMRAYSLMYWFLYGIACYSIVYKGIKNE